MFTIPAVVVAIKTTIAIVAAPETTITAAVIIAAESAALSVAATAAITGIATVVAAVTAIAIPTELTVTFMAVAAIIAVMGVEAGAGIAATVETTAIATATGAGIAPRVTVGTPTGVIRIARTTFVCHVAPLRKRRAFARLRVLGLSLTDAGHASLFSSMRQKAMRPMVSGTASAACHDTEGLLATAQHHEPALEEITIAKQLLLIFHTHIVHVHATGLDRLARLRDGLEQPGTHRPVRSGLREGPVRTPFPPPHSRL